MYYVVWSLGWDWSPGRDSTIGGSCLLPGYGDLETALAMARAANEDARRRGADVGPAYIEDPETGDWLPTGMAGEAVVTDGEGRRKPVVEAQHRRLALGIRH